MKVIIAGSRHIQGVGMLDFIESVVRASGFDVTEVVCGMAPGIDTYGREWADFKWKPVRKLPADWKKHGKAAGPIRNREMAKYADALILIWDGKSRGSANMLDQARVHGLQVHEVIV